MLLSIIIVSYNVHQFLFQCLESIWKSVDFAQIETEVFVVDNNSSDGTVEFLRKKNSRFLDIQNSGKCCLHLISNYHNVGFGRANNQALQLSRGRYVLFLNPDTLLTEHTLQDCIHVMNSHTNVGAIGVEMLQSNGIFAPESRRALPNPWVAFCKLSGLTSLFPHNRFLGRYYMGYLPIDEISPIDIVSGAFMFCSRSALDKCGSFDEDFFMYGEDIDLSYRFLKGGFQNYYVPSPILHYKGESTRKNTYKYVHVFYQAMLIFFRKHFPLISWILSLPAYIIIFLKAFASLLYNNLQALAHFLNPYGHPVSLNICFIGSDQEFDKISIFAETHGLSISHKYEVSKQNNADIIVFSVEEYTYFSMLEALADSNHKSRLGTFYPKTGLLILGREAYE